MLSVWGWSEITHVAGMTELILFGVTTCDANRTA